MNLSWGIPCVFEVVGAFPWCEGWEQLTDCVPDCLDGSRRGFGKQVLELGEDVLESPDTQVQSGIDFHFDWSTAQFLSKQTFVGLVGYAYQQVTDDTGGHPILAGVFGMGPQIGYIFPLGGMQGYLNLKAYGEFDAANRPGGLECVADVCDFAGGTHRSHADPPPGYEVIDQFPKLRCPLFPQQGHSSGRSLGQLCAMTRIECSSPHG
jgi:outer membrane putative beta-barrel porin/alpha-amylase